MTAKFFIFSATPASTCARNGEDARENRVVEGFSSSKCEEHDLRNPCLVHEHARRVIVVPEPNHDDTVLQTEATAPVNIHLQRTAATAANEDS